MCGIVGAVAERDVVPILIEGLKRLEYRGYASAGVAIVDNDGCINRVRMPGKVAELEKETNKVNLNAHLGIAHTRWATHGKPTQNNAHPHVCRKSVAVVHNGIIENHEELKQSQLKQGYRFTSETDTEVVVHQVHFHHINEGQDLLSAVQDAVAHLDGAFALGVLSKQEPGRLIASRK